MTIEDAARNYVRAYQNWRHAKEAHREFCYHNECDHMKLATEDYNPGRCRIHLPQCANCQRSLPLYLHRVDMARKKGRAHATLTMLVARREK